MRTTLIAAAAAATALAPLAGCTHYTDPWGGAYERHYAAGAYDPYPLSHSDRVYRGADGRYYCQRRDGTVGLVVGAGVGALAGAAIAGRGSRTLGALLGGAGGAAIGYAIERQEIQCH